MTNKFNKPIYKLTFSAMIIAAYIIIMFVTQWFAFGAIQIRLATSLYALPAIFPFLIFPLALANALSNTLFGGLGLIDIVGGFGVGLITSYLVYKIASSKLNTWLISLPIIFIPGLIVPLWLAPLLTAIDEAFTITYWALAVSITLGQIIPGILGAYFIKYIKKNHINPLTIHSDEYLD